MLGNIENLLLFKWRALLRKGGEGDNVCEKVMYICLLMDIVVQHVMIKQTAIHMFLMFNYILMEILSVLVVVVRLSIKISQSKLCFSDTLF